jgi:hypothetical protein
MANPRVKAVRALRDAIPHVSPDVIVISTDFYATSMPSHSAEDLDAQLVLLKEAVKKLTAWRRNRAQLEIPK